MASPAEHLEIALAIQLGVPHLERVVQGIRDYAQHHTTWRFVLSPETHHLQPTALVGWPGDGVIALCNTSEDVAVLESLSCPVLNISGVLAESPFPRVRNDYAQLGRMGAHHLLDRGYRRFGFYGMEGVWYSQRIEGGFMEVIEARGGQVQALHAPSSLGGATRWNHGQDELEAWLNSLEPPFAVMAAHDPRAAMVMRACERSGLNIPSEVGVIGVNEDTVTCEACQPPLSSIDRNSRELGWEVARILDDLLQGRQAPPETIVQPGGIRERESTGAIVTEHPALTAAVEFVQDHYAEAISVEQMAEAAGRSRRWLEETFRRELNRSPAEFLRAVRVDAAEKTLNTNPSLQLSQLATACGFTDSRQLNAAFRRLRGMSVRAYLAERKA